jgi:hypothetical protein
LSGSLLFTQSASNCAPRLEHSLIPADVRFLLILGYCTFATSAANGASTTLGSEIDTASGVEL